MKITIHNLGFIDKAEIDLRPLTVFIGNNGTGKTWTAYTLSSVFSAYGCRKYLEAYLDNRTRQKYPVLEDMVQQIINEGSAKIDMVEFADKYLELYINDVANMASGWMNSFMASERADFEKLRLDIMLAESKGMLIERIKTASLEGNIAKESVKASKEEGDSTLYFYTKDNVSDKLSGNIVRQFSIETVLNILHYVFYQNISLFPTERTTFIIFPFVKREKLKDSDPVTETILPGAIQHFSRMITWCSNVVKKDRQNQQYIKLVEVLETEILQGKVDFETSKLKKELLFHVSKNLKLEMAVASSMIKELAPLALYLKNLAEPGDLLIIDEPEMNLHPAAQVELIEFFAMLVNAGLNILITTHSPYIVDHLANLMQAAKHKNKKKIKKLFYLEKTEAFISQDKVSVYLFEDGIAKNIVDENGVIDWGTFGNVSSDLSRIYSEILKD
ncbi:MAG: hypothetical protein BWK80_18910 [Desulfobacteraceae bacterium IS3]|nr:MAG: hypothetical protein BWK80_18910 [Desulfobacteraceae bacterium IS3]